MQRLLIGTTNLAKSAEVRGVFAVENLDILSLKDFPDIRMVDETGATFKENAILKARGYFTQTGTPTIADDGGLVIDALGGLPGVHSQPLAWTRGD